MNERQAGRGGETLNINTLVNFFASRTIVVAVFPSQNDTLIKQITVPPEKDLQECDKAGGR